MFGGLVEGKVALVTGAGSGIGEATALLLAAEGATGVVVADRDEAAAEAVASRVRDAGADALAIPVDVADEPGVMAMVTAATARFGRLDIAHNNAGISGGTASFTELSLEDWNGLIQINLTGVFLCMREELKVMAAQGSGVIVNTSSVAGVVPAMGLPHYTAAKHGVLGLTKCAAREYVRQGIRVNAVLPGATRTPMLEAAIDGSEEIEKLMRRGVARGALGAPNEIAEAVVWLCSERASFVSGESLVLDGATLCR